MADVLNHRNYAALGLVPSKHATWEPYEPSLRDRIGDFVYDNANALGLPAQQYRDNTEFAADFVPGLGDALGAQDAKRDYDAGNYGMAALGGGLTAVGVLPFAKPFTNAAKKSIQHIKHPAMKEVREQMFSPKVAARYARENGLDVSANDVRGLREVFSERMAEKNRVDPLIKNSLNRHIRTPTAKNKHENDLLQFQNERKLKALEQQQQASQRIDRIESIAGAWNKSFKTKALEAAKYGNAHDEINKANGEAISRLLRSEGWTGKHVSAGRDKRAASRYLVSPDGKFNIRLSDHDLPDTPAREYNHSQFGKSWNEEVVLSGDDNAVETVDLIKSSYQQYLADEQPDSLGSILAGALK